jgi:hypothetical protein
MALNRNFPTPPIRNVAGGGSLTFPGDLIQNQRQFYTEISFVDYGLGGMGGMNFGGAIRLPIPRKLNDVEVILWEEWSALDKGKQFLSNSLVAGIDALTAPVSTYFGAQVNPFQFMMFKRPNFKEHVLQWQLAPNNRQESETLIQIINKCKKAALPTPMGQLLMKYPQIAQVRFSPDKYLYKIKPCAIISVQVDYNGAGQPSFFNSGAPTVVNLTLQLKEIRLQNTRNYEQ